MELGFDHQEFALRSQAMAHPSGEPRLEWLALRARLVAAHQARIAIFAPLRQAGDRLGSFDSRAAAVLVAHESAGVEASRPVNPTALVDGKVPAGITAHVAGPATVGDRG